MMPNDRFRPLRQRWEGLRDPGAAAGRPRTPALDAPPASSTPRFVGRVVDKGAIPTAADRVFLVNPAILSGTESEGAAASLSVDSSRTIPVVVVGATAPKAGDALVAFAVAGRWVAQVGGAAAPSITCGTCSIPRRDLALTLSDGVAGTFTAPLTFNGVDAWATGCIAEVIYQLKCSGSLMTFSAIYHVGGSCPGGTAVACTGPGTGLTLSSRSCSPFMLVYTPANCPSLIAQGIATLTITQ